MDVPVGIIFGIVAMVAWGTADFCAAYAVKKASVLRTAIWSQLIGFALFSIVFFLFFDVQTLSLIHVAVITLVGILGAAVFISFYKALEIGPVSVVSPIVSCWVVVTVLLSIVFLGERLGQMQLYGIALAIAGAVLASFKWIDLKRLNLKNNLKGVRYALFALFGWGVAFAFIGYLAGQIGWFLPIFLQRGVLVITLLSYGSLTDQKISFPKSVALFVGLVAILETVAFLGYGLGINSEYTSIVAPVSAAFPAVTVILAKIFFKERLDLNQVIGIFAILGGIILLSL